MANARKANRPYPTHILEDVLPIPQKIQDEMAGRPMKRLLLADALGIKPASSNFKSLLSSSQRYGLTDGTEKATEVKPTAIGSGVGSRDAGTRRAALLQAAMKPDVFRRFYETYDNASFHRGR